MNNNDKHAYLVMAHNNFRVLETLLCLLDDDRNDIYIHIDKKVKSFDFDYYRTLCKNSKIVFLSRRINVRWGRNSQTNAEMELFNEAHSYNNYAYYHLISGVDLPIKSRDYIYNFFQEHSESFIYFSPKVTSAVYERLSLFFHLPINNKMVNVIENYLRKLQRKIGVNRFSKWERKGYTLEKGPNWVSLTNEAVEALLREKRTIQKMTRFSHCADELYKQIILKKAGVPIYRDQYGNTMSMRLTDWERGDGSHPYVFRMCDYKMLMDSPKCFARKFDQTIDYDIVKTIYRELSNS